MVCPNSGASASRGDGDGGGGSDGGGGLPASIVGGSPLVDSVASAAGTEAVPADVPPSPRATTAVARERALVTPCAFVPVTASRIVAPTSARPSR
jgi:hypothetical protein